MLRKRTWNMFLMSISHPPSLYRLSWEEVFQKDAREYIVKIPKETHTTRKNYRRPKTELDLSQF